MKTWKQLLGVWLLNAFESYWAIMEFVMIAGAVCLVAMALFSLWSAA